MILDLYISFIASVIFITFMPGPTILLVVHYALQHGRSSGKFSIPAVILGDISAIIFAFTGLGAIIKLFPDSLVYFKII